jgi:uncharacterized protein YqeY
MDLKEKLQEDMKDAMRAGDDQRRDVLRLLLAAVKQEEVDSRTTLGDEGVQEVLSKQAKQRREAIADAQKAGREQMAEEERAELAIIKAYLPEQMSREEIRALANEVIVEVGASDMQEMGQVMARLMPKVKGRADGRVVSSVVRDLLS